MREALATEEVRRSDEELLAAARTGSRGALAILFHRHHRHALRYARSVSRSGPEAEDLAAESFVRMMSAIESGKGPVDNVSAYLRTTVRNLSVDVGVKTSRSVPMGLTVDSAEERDVHFGLAEVDGEETLEAAFRSLAPRWRRVLWMVEVLGYRPSEVAVVLDLAPPAACSLLWRARKALRERFQELSTAC